MMNILSDYTGILPECPTWCPSRQTLFWTDILRKEIHRYHPATGRHQVLNFPQQVGSFALCEQGGFIVAMRDAIWLTDEEGRLQHKVADNPSNPVLARFNDGGTDGQGRFYAGTYWSPGDYNGAVLMRVDNQLQCKVIQCDIKGHNGLAFSPDGRWMYTTDTPNAILYRTPLDAQGEPGERQVLRRFSEQEGAPDGAAIDSEGGYWAAMYNGYKVVRFSPEGETLAEFPLPVRCPSMVCFGGPEMKTLYITTTRENMTEQELQKRPLSGAIFVLNQSIAGIAHAPFRYQTRSETRRRQFTED